VNRSNRSPLLAEVHWKEMPPRVTSEAIQAHGGDGFTDELPESHFYRGARYGAT